jgi:hypothetical protein
VHEQGNHMADAIAEAAYSDGTHPLYTWKLPSASRTTVTINNDQIFSKHLTIFRNTDDETFAELTRTLAVPDGVFVVL